MKKYIVMICLTLLCVGCSTNDLSDDINVDIETVVESFYNTGYDYTQTSINATDGNELKTIVEGQVFTNPYKEYQNIVTYDDGEIVDSQEYYCEDNTIRIVYEDGTSQDAFYSRIYPYGYDRKITFTKDDNIMLDEQKLQIYKAVYQEEIGKSFQLTEKIIAEISQTYYLNEKNEIVRIETDLDDYYRGLGVAQNMAINGLSREEAEEEYHVIYGETSFTDVLEIRNYGNPTEFDKE